MKKHSNPWSLKSGNMRYCDPFATKPSISQRPKRINYNAQRTSVTLLRSFLTLCRFRDEFLELMRKSLLGVHIVGFGPHMDHRYFYIDSKFHGRYSCGLARQAITEFLRMNAEESIFLGAEWYDTLIAFKNKPSVTSFIVEQIVISKIASAGLRWKNSISHLPQFSHSILSLRDYQSVNHSLITCWYGSTKKLSIFCLPALT